MDKLKLLNNNQSEYLLLKFCAGIPRFFWNLRTTESHLIPRSIQQFDTAVSQATLRTLGQAPLSANTITRLSLPTSDYAGYGIPKAVDLAPAARLASITDCLELTAQLLKLPPILRNNMLTFGNHALTTIGSSFSTAFTTMEQRLPQGTTIDTRILLGIKPPPGPIPGVDIPTTSRNSQNYLSSLIHNETMRTLEISYTPNPYAALVYKVVKDRDSGGFLKVYPRNEESTLTNLQWIYACRFYFGEKMFRSCADGLEKCPTCTKTMDTNGYHIMNCATGRGCHQTRHTKVKAFLVDFSRKSGIRAIEEESGIFGASNNARPSDITLFDVYGDKIAVDVNITNVMLNYNAGPFDPMASINASEKKKLQTNYQKLQTKGYRLVPFICGTLGRRNKASEEILRFLALSYADNMNMDASVALSWIRQGLSTIIYKYLADAAIYRGELTDRLLK